jgi:hypothetical protein
MEDRNTVRSLVLHLAIACSLPCRVQVQFTLGDGAPMIGLFIKRGWFWELLLWLLVLELARVIGG